MNDVWREARVPLVASLVTTVGRDGSKNASPKSWWSPIDYEPPRLALAVRKDSDTHRNIEETGIWVLHVPPGGDDETATKVLHTAKPLPYGEFELDDVGLKYAQLMFGRRGFGPIPVIDDMPYFACAVEMKVDGSDHDLYIGTVMEAGLDYDEGDRTVKDVLIHVGRNVFHRLGERWEAEPY